jgi:hypothetical protein
LKQLAAGNNVTAAILVSKSFQSGGKKMEYLPQEDSANIIGAGESLLGNQEASQQNLQSSVVAMER